MKRFCEVAFLSIFLLFLAGCATMGPVAPEPVEPVVSDNAAVVALLDTAGSQFACGELGAAGSSLERALRIEPRNPCLWQELARVRLNQGLYREAENLAAKSNTLVAGNRKLVRENWRIIGQARTRLGDYQGAQMAFEKADEE